MYNNVEMFMIGFDPSNCNNADGIKLEMLQTKMKCKNYTTGQPTLVVGDSQGSLANHIWSYVFRLAIKVG